MNQRAWSRYFSQDIRIKFFLSVTIIGIPFIEFIVKNLESLIVLFPRPPSLHYASELAEKFPKLTFVLDHIAKPYIKDQIMDGWKEDIIKAAQHPNVYCKL